MFTGKLPQKQGTPVLAERPTHEVHLSFRVDGPLTPGRAWELRLSRLTRPQQNPTSFCKAARKNNV